MVVEDVELAAEPRGRHAPLHPALLRLLSEMEGTGDDADVTFLLTTNRADLLEEVLAARPGQVNHTARLPLPDATARRRLLRLYQGSLRISRSSASTVVARTDGVNASFIRELLRRAAVYAADGRAARAAAPAAASGLAAVASGSHPGQANGTAPASGVIPAEASGLSPATDTDRDQVAALRVSARHLNLALDELLDSQARPDPGAARQPPHARGGRRHPPGPPPPPPHPLIPGRTQVTGQPVEWIAARGSLRALSPAGRGEREQVRTQRGGHLGGSGHAGQVRGARITASREPSIPRAMTAPCHGGVAGSSDPEITSVGAEIPARDGRRSIPAMASQQPA